MNTNTVIALLDIYRGTTNTYPTGEAMSLEQKDLIRKAFVANRHLVNSTEGDMWNTTSKGNNLVEAILKVAGLP